MGRRLPLALLVLALAATPAWAAVITGTNGPDALTGTADADSIYARGGDDRVDGGGGDDTLDGGPGADDLRGGAGSDAVSYAQATADVVVTLDDSPEDGQVGEKDNVRPDVEDIFGGAYADELVGDEAANTIDGGPGNDILTGAAGTDGLFGGPGADTLNARDGSVDTVDCGPGEDVATIDTSDKVIGCERRGRARRLPVVIGSRWKAYVGYTMFTRLQVTDIDVEGTVVQVRCKGRGCPFRSRKQAAGTRTKVSFTSRFRKRRLRGGARLEVLVTAPGYTGKYLSFKVRTAKGPVERKACVEFGALKPTPC